MPRIIGPADDGRTYTMRIGDPVDLAVPDPLAPDPVIEGASIELTEILNIQASGKREWEVRAVAAGRTVVRGGGSLPYVITIDVIEG